MHWKYQEFVHISHSNKTRVFTMLIVRLNKSKHIKKCEKPLFYYLLTGIHYVLTLTILKKEEKKKSEKSSFLSSNKTR